MTAIDPDIGDTITWSIAGGSDAALFEINPVTGLLSFKSAPAYIAPADVGANNVYDVVVRSSDGNSFAEQAIAVSVLDGPDNFFGTHGDDVFVASDASNWTITGQGGNDLLIGNGGNDVIEGGGGSDVLVGGDGNDTLDGGPAQDVDSAAFIVPGNLSGTLRLVSGVGVETGLAIVERVDGATIERLFVIAPQGTGAATITGINAAASLGTDTVTNIDQLLFGLTTTPALAVNLTVTASGFNTGSPPVATITGSIYNDTIDASQVYSGVLATQNVNIFGSIGDDTIIGHAGNNFLIGGDGNDTLFGGAGSDVASFSLAVGATGVLRAVDGTGADSAAKLIVRLDSNGQVIEQVARAIRNADGTVTVAGLGTMASLGTDTLTGMETLSFSINGGIAGNGVAFGIAVNTVVNNATTSTINGSALGETLNVSSLLPAAGSSVLVNVNANGGNDTIIGRSGPGTDNANYFNGTGTGVFVWSLTDGSGADAGKLVVSRTNGTITEALFRVTPTGTGAATVESLGSSLAITGTDTVTEIENLNFSGGGSSNIGTSIRLIADAGAISGSFAQVNGSVNDDSLDLNALYSSNPTLNANINADRGNDLLIGNAGANYLEGGIGNDSIDGGSGIDVTGYRLPAGLTGTLRAIAGSGADAGRFFVERVEGATVEQVLRIERSGATVTVTGLNSAASLGTDTLVNVERLDVAFANNSGQIFLTVAPYANPAQNGFDNIDGSLFSDVLDIGTLLPAETPLRSTYVAAREGDDTIIGTAFNSFVEGGAGNDTIDGGIGGNDTAGYTLAAGTPGTLRIVDGSGGDAGKFIVQRVDGAVVEDLFRITHASSGSATVEGLNSAVSFGTDTVTRTASLFFRVEDSAASASLQIGPSAYLDNTGTWGISGSRFNDTINTAALAPGILAGAPTRIYGDAGDDLIFSGSGNDDVVGGTGNDTVVYSGARSSYAITREVPTGNIIVSDLRPGAPDGTDTLNSNDIETLRFTDRDYAAAEFGAIIDGTSGNDQIFGTPGADTVNGLGGDDTVTTTAGDDTLIGGAGNDYLNGGGGDDVAVYSGNLADYTISHSFGETSIVDNRPGSPDGSDKLNVTVDRVRFADQTLILPGSPGLEINPSDGSQPAILTGGAGDDSINGTVLGDTLNGAGGDDSIFANDGNDIVSGGAGDDILTGWVGDDTINGGTGADSLFGNDGDDVLIGGFDTRIEAQAGDQGDQIFGDGGNDVLFGGDGDDRLFGGEGSDDIRADAGNDQIYGGAGTDLASYRFNDFSIGRTLDYRNFAATAIFSWDDGRGGIDQVSDVEALFLSGTQGADVILGSLYTTPFAPIGYANFINALNGNDSVTGGNNRDRLLGGGGDDSLSGLNGDDDLVGGNGNDTINGGNGIDTAVFNAGVENFSVVRLANNDVGVTDLRSGSPEGNDTLTSIENLAFVSGGVTKTWSIVNTIGSDSDEGLFGFSGDDLVVGNGGNDYMNGGGGSDLILGGTGRDTAAFALPVGTTGTLRVVDGANVLQLLVQRVDGNTIETIFQIDFTADGATAIVTGVGSQAATVGSTTVRNVEQLDFFIQQPNNGNIPNGQYAGINFAVNAGAISYQSFANGNFAFVGGSEIADTINVGALYPGVLVTDRIDIWAGRGDDIIIGHAGDSYIRGENGNDTVDGGAGTDVVQFQLPAGTTGTLRVVDDPANAGKLLVQLVEGAVVTDVYRVTVTGTGAATIEGLGPRASDGVDTVTNVESLSFSGDAGNQYAGINLVVQTYTSSPPPFANGSEAPDGINLATLFGSGNSNANGGRGNDTIIGSDGTNFIVGGGGSDSIDGAGGYDYAQFMLPVGTTGTLQVVDDPANAGNLLVQLVNGTTVTDVYRVTPLTTGSATVEALGSLGLQGTDTVTNIEELHFFVELAVNGPFASILLGVQADSSSPPSANGSVASDTIDLGALFGSGNSNANGNRGDDTIIGSAGNNFISGGAGNDTISGLGGDDNFEGEAGNDSYEGGTGTDFIRYVLPAGTSGTFSIIDGALADTYVVRRTVSSGFEEMATITVSPNGTATVTGTGVAAGFGSDTVANVERLEFYVNGGSFTSINFGPTAFAANGANPAFIQGSIGADTFSVADFFPVAGSGTRVNINSDRGNDVITGHSGANIISGGAGDDALYGVGGADILIGGLGADVLEGGDGDDFLVGALNPSFGPQPGDGADLLRGGKGNDGLFGGDGDDQMFGDADDDNLRGDAGSDLLDGGAGGDFASFFFTAASSGITVDFRAMGLGADYLFADPLGGTDTLRSIEFLSMGGSNFDDVLYGSELLLSGGGSIVGVDRRAANQMGGNAGNDILVGGGDFDYLDGGTGNDMLDGRGGSDLATYAFGGNNEITGAPLATSGVTFTAAAMTTPGATVQIDAGPLGIDTLTNIEGFNLGGTDFADSLTGSAGNDILFGAAGNDILNGLGGNDYIDGSDGNDTIDGGGGDDTVWLSGSRSDYDISRLIDGSLRVTDLRTGDTNDGIDSLTGVENLFFEGDGTTVVLATAIIGTLNAELLTGTAVADTIFGGGGDDFLRGGDGNDVLFGGTGNDSFDESLAALGDDTIDGGDGNDQMVDFAGTNILRGGNGNDLMGGTGTLYGGAGNDTFLYLASGATADTYFGEAGSDVYMIIPVDATFALDRVADFDLGADLIAVHFLVDEMIGWGGGFAFQMFSQGYLRFVQNGTDATLQFDRDGSAGGAFGFVDQVVLSNQGSALLTNLQNRVTLYASSSAGTVGANTLNGSNADDPAIRGHGGDDTINGLGGVDFIEGGMGNDALNGGDGNDVLQGDYGEKTSGGDDTLSGGKGNDGLFGSAGNDTLDGGADNDILNGGAGRDVLTGGTGADRFVLEASAGTTLALADQITDFSISDGDRLQLGPGLGFADLTITDDNGSAVISVTATGAYLAVLANTSAAALTPAQFVSQIGLATPADGDTAANSVNEAAASGTTVGITAFASAANGSAVTYSLSDTVGGRFAIDAATGVVTTAAALDAETAASHAITVVATAADGATSSQSFTIAVNDINEFAVTTPIDGDASANLVAENAAAGSSVFIAAFASDADATTNTVTYSLSDDAGGRFAIDAVTGAVTTAASLDFEAAASHDITVLATSADGSSASRSFTVTVGNVNEAPAITSLGGGATAAVEVAEGVTAVTVLAASDPDAGAVISWSISGGADAALFTIDSATGALSFLAAPSHAAPADAGLNNVYGVVVSASDGALTDEQALAVTVLPGLSNFVGTSGDDVFTANNGSDWTISGLAGSDTLSGNSGNDLILGGAGDDLLSGGAGNDTLDGGADNDTASYRTATAGVAVDLGVATAQATGGAGSDTLAGIENLLGSAFNDVLTGDAGANTIEGGDGNDALDGDTGTDTLSYAGAAAAISVTLATTLAQNTGGAGTDTVRGFENLLGSAFNDTLTGNGGSNVIDGGSGSDSLDGAAGIDVASYASAGAGVTVSLALTTAQDTLGAGIDTLVNFENLNGSAFDDVLAGNAGGNIIDGGDGIDTVSYAAAAAGVTVALALTTAQSTGGAGSDTLRNIENLIGSDFNDVLAGNAGDNVLGGSLGTDTVTYARASAGVTVSLGLQGSAQDTLGAGSDTLSGIENLTGSAFEDVLSGDAGDNALDGGLGLDMLSYAEAAAGVTISLALTTAQSTGGAGTDTVRGFERLAGSAFNDVLTGSTAANVLFGDDGDDALDGGSGDDDLDGAEGDDTLVGATGNDTLRGGIGNDTASYAAGLGVVVDLGIAGEQNTVGAGLDTLIGIENLIGSTRADTLGGNSGDNTLDGGAGTDTVSYANALAAVTVSLALQNSAQDTEGAGVDTLLNFENLTGSAFDDTLAGNVGNNIIDGSAGVDTLSYAAAAAGVTLTLALTTAQNTVGAGSDTVRNIENLIGSAFNDVLSGDGGNNELAGGDGIDTVTYARAAAGVTVSLAQQAAAQDTGGAGIDLLTGFENLTGSAFDDTLAGDAGSNAMDGGLGIDTLSYADAAAGVTVSLALTTAQDTVGAGTDTIKGFERLSGSAFGDMLTGSTTANILFGDDGDDALDGGSGDDELDGGDNDDVLTGGAGNDILRGGNGSDTASYATATAAVLVDLSLAGAQNTVGAGVDQLFDIENLTGSSRADTLGGNTGDNRLDGGAGTDTVSYASAAAAVTVSLALQGVAQDTGGAGNDTLLAFENLLGSAFDDTLAGNAGTNVIDGGAGVDTVNYAAAAAGVSISLALTAGQATGGAGTDTLRNVENLVGSGLNDTLSGDAGDNILDGAAGIDTVTYLRAAAGVTVSLALQGSGQNTGGNGSDTLINFENLTGSAFDDILSGDGGNNALDGGAGIDILSYADAATGVTVSLAVTTAQNTGGAGTDTIRNFERLIGSDFNDVLTGSTSANVLTGGSGADRLTGGSGADVFRFENTGDFGDGIGRDRITDFSRTQLDKIDLSAIDSNAGLAGDQGFQFIGTAAFSGQAGELRYAFAAGVFTVSGDVNGDGFADFAFDLSGAGLANLQQPDFVL